MSSRSPTCDKAGAHLGRTPGTVPPWRYSGWDGSSAGASPRPTPWTVSLPSRLWQKAVSLQRPPAAPSSPSQEQDCLQARAGAPAQALGLGQPTQDSVCISPGFCRPGFTCPTPAGSAQESCLGPCLGRSWELHHLEVLSRWKMFPHAGCPHYALYVAETLPCLLPALAVGSAHWGKQPEEKEAALESMLVFHPVKV